MKSRKALKKDMLAYRATAELKSGLNDAAMADCQTLAESYSMDAETYYLTGCVALAMDSYDEASSNFTEATEKMPLMTERSRSMRHIWKRIWKQMVHDILRLR
mgnify:FL=1